MPSGVAGGHTSGSGSIGEDTMDAGRRRTGHRDTSDGGEGFKSQVGAGVASYVSCFKYHQ